MGVMAVLIYSTFSRALELGWGVFVEYTDCRVRPHPNECPGYNSKQSDDEDPVLLELWEMQSSPPLRLLPSPRVVVPNRVLSMCQMELNCILILN